MSFVINTFSINNIFHKLIEQIYEEQTQCKCENNFIQYESFLEIHYFLTFFFF